MRASEGNPARLQEALGSKYQVLRWIGGGGMAQVYLARNRDTGGLFAVKVLADHLSSEDAVVARFLQEARTSAALSGHPNIVSIFDVGQFEDTHYIIMQYVEGEDLKAYLKRRGKLPPEETGRIVEQIAEALVFAHSHAVVHRDLKPSNVKIQNSGRAVVLDFGIAKAGDAPSQLTAVDQRVGTPYYMSPEHFMAGACDARSDLYALGVVFFELLTGRRPFEGDSVQEIEAAHRNRPAPSPCEMDPGIPEAYGRMVLRLLEKRPEDRYQNAAGLVADIRQAGGSETVQPAPEPAVPEVPQTPPPEAPAPARRPVSFAMFLIAGALLAGILIGGFYWSTRGGRQQTPQAKKPAGDSSDMLQVSEAALLVDRTAVTNTTYKTFCDETGHPYPDPLPKDPEYFYTKPDARVVNVTYSDAVAFAVWAGKRLPTAAEWEHARRTVAAGTGAEWTSTPYKPSPSGALQGEWFVVKGDSSVPGLPSEPRAPGVAVGFRCVKDTSR